MTIASASRRTFEDVHARSREAGTFERNFWIPLDPLDPGRWRIVREAERFSRRTKKPGARSGALGHAGEAVMRYLASIVGADGRLDPSLATIAKACALARSTVQKAIKALVASDFLERVRRFVRVDQPRVGRCPPVRQTSNAYRLKMRPPAAPSVFVGGAPMIPADALQRQAEAERQAAQSAADWAAMTEAERWAIVRPGARPPAAPAAPAGDAAAGIAARIEALVARSPQPMTEAERRHLVARLTRQAAERPTRNERDTAGRCESPTKDIRLRL